MNRSDFLGATALIALLGAVAYSHGRSHDKPVNVAEACDDNALCEQEDVIYISDDMPRQPQAQSSVRSDEQFRLVRAEELSSLILPPVTVTDRESSLPDEIASDYKELGAPRNADRGRSSEVFRQAIVAYETKLAVVADNLANAETIAFKRSRAILEPTSYRNLKLPGNQDTQGNFTPTGIAVGLGVRVQSTQTDFAQGGFRQTNRELDVAIEGKGFFQVTDPDSGQIVYSRAGDFSVNSVGQMVIGSASTGGVVNPAITFPTDATGILISPNGTVQFQQANTQNLNHAGQLQLATFINPEGLVKIGENLYRQTDSSGSPQIGTPGQNGLGVVRQAALELSNVDVREESREWTQTRAMLKTLESLLDAE